ncbi:MAG TPA: NUDIX domain-containing protein [Candidatus Saccharimonadales bacterium]|nr:NUDIX domain-containing protein [Candidatus Saccharimonadales bacterium]
MLSDILDRYLKLFPEEKEELKLLAEQVKTGQDLNDRRNFHGHVTGSTIVLSNDRRRVLLIHHKSFNLWQQPGGHRESDEPNPLEAARREAPEETGIQLGEYLAVDKTNPLVPIDIDTHLVPARPHKNEPDHYHHDFRYVFIAKSEDIEFDQKEVYGAGWFDLDDSQTERISGVIVKLRQFKFIS